MSGGFNPVNLVTQTALAGLTGGTSLIVSQMLRQVVSSLIQNVIQTIGTELGVPQSVIDMAQGAAAGSVGDFQGAAQNYGEAAQGFTELAGSFAQQLGASPREQGEFENLVQNQRDSFLDSLRKNNPFVDEEGNSGAFKAQSGGKGSWLMALAAALGRKLDEAQAQFESKMDSTDWEDSKASMEMQASAQEFSLFMSTATNVIKTVGEALSQMARKQ
ncbi:hypothetical protein ABC347_09255 [Sphingomonas sp. 1P06PA]|uniref:hypothetical protein n=1 Tax=Sphingomonas sp. 1P06PA TaxID=554121 RepID=UPI0039A454A7